MDLYDKMALDALYTINKNAVWKQSYRHIHSNFVAYGAAVSFVGASYINSPWSWSASILNYENVLNEGSWGVMHENNHQNQGSWGYTGSGEVTNNVLTIASYLNFTNVSNNRYKWINYNATDGKISKRGNNHIYKLNGYLNVDTYLDEYVNDNNSPDKNKAREGIDYDYSVIMSHFGTSTFQKIIRSYSDSTVTDFEGNKITIPESIKNDRNAIFVYRISAVTGYDWIEYTYNSGLISSDMKTKLETALSTNFPVTNTNDSTGGNSGSGSSSSTTNKNRLKKFLPVGSFYASQVAYDVATDENGNVIEPNNYTSIQRPFLIPKTAFTSGYKFNLSDSTKTATKKQMDSNYTLSDYKITKNPNSRSSYDSSSNTLTYYPDTSNLNNTDSFEYEVTVKDGGSNQYIVRYKVDLQLEGNTTEFVVPSNENYQQYYSSQITSYHNDINWDTNVTVGSEQKSLSLLRDNTSGSNNFTAATTKDSTSNDFLFTFEIPFRRDVDVNYLELWPNSVNRTAPDGIIIKDAKDNILFEGDFEKTAYPKFSFPSARTNKLKVSLKTFDREAGNTGDDGVTSFTEKPVSRTVQVWYLDAGLKVSPTLILTPDSEWIYTVGDWKRGNKDGKVNGASLYTILPGTKVAFGFRGTAFTIVGTKDIGYGSFNVYIDHKYYSTVSTSSKSRSANEGLFSASNLSEGEHYVSITTKNSAPVEIQYFALEGTAQPISVNDWFYFLAIGLSIIVLLTIVITVLSVMYYLKVKNKRITIFDKFKSKFKAKPNRLENDEDDEIALEKVEEKNNSKPIENKNIDLKDSKEFKKEEQNKNTETKPKKDKDKKSKRNK
ncbi:putative integral membrane protein [Malacoplasma penetrans HF-2]|uniref:Integral membrane protein n=2 Tax=Malacoplasma penetrans TaxID=28227 RepID=Q8EVX8_MALP2|nr:putative integral membrane protein [Malacoplasma penetrans HF-2]